MWGIGTSILTVFLGVVIVIIGEAITILFDLIQIKEKDLDRTQPVSELIKNVRIIQAMSIFGAISMIVLLASYVFPYDYLTTISFGIASVTGILLAVFLHNMGRRV